MDKGFVVFTKRLLFGIVVIIVALALYEIGDALYIDQTTGTLSASSGGAFLTVEQKGSELANIGVSKSLVRLRPGQYTLVASIGHSQSMKLFTITAKQTTTVDVVVKSVPNPGQSESAIKGNELIRYLPFIGPNFSYEISYKYNFTAVAALPVIVITAPNVTGQQAALAAISVLGINPLQLNIEYVNSSPQPAVNTIH